MNEERNRVIICANATVFEKGSPRLTRVAGRLAGERQDFSQVLGGFGWQEELLVGFVCWRYRMLTVCGMAVTRVL